MATADVDFDVQRVAPARRRIDAMDRAKYRTYFITGLLTVLVPLAGTLYAGYLLSQEGLTWLNLALMVVMYVPTVLGIELGYHRYLAHHSLKTTPGITSALAVLGSMAGHGPPIWWIAVHRRHHQNSDHPGDPHSPNLHGESLWESIKGGWHAHIGWMFKPEHTESQAANYARDLLRDRRIHGHRSALPAVDDAGFIYPGGARRPAHAQLLGCLDRVHLGRAGAAVLRPACLVVGHRHALPSLGNPTVPQW